MYWLVRTNLDASRLGFCGSPLMQTLVSLFFTILVASGTTHASPEVLTFSAISILSQKMYAFNPKQVSRVSPYDPKANGGRTEDIRIEQNKKKGEGRGSW